jgi:hypothetical protein
MDIKETAKNLGEGFAEGAGSVAGIAGLVFTIAIGVKLGLVAAAALIGAITPRS